MNRSNLPLVSVIIPTYNRTRFVCEAVESAVNQTYPSLEIFVIDDGSTDSTEKDVKKFGDNIIYLKQGRKGVCAARNAAIRRAKGKYIAFLDDDDVWLPEKIEKDVAYLEGHPDCGFVFSGFSYLSDKGELIEGTRSFSDKTKMTYESMYNDNLINSTSLVTMSKKCLEEVGFFDEDLIQSADYDMWLRASKKFKFGYISDCLAKYRIHNTNMSKNLRRRIKVYKQIFNKPNNKEGKNWMQRRTRFARFYYYLAHFFRKHHRYGKAALYYSIAIIHCPVIGRHYWPKEVANMRFTFLYRIVRTYFLVFYCLVKFAFFPKKKVPELELVDV